MFSKTFHIPQFMLRACYAATTFQVVANTLLDSIIDMAEKILVLLLYI